MRRFLGLTLTCAVAAGLVSCKPFEGGRPDFSTSNLIQIPGLLDPATDSNEWLKEAYQVRVMTPLDNKADSKVELAVAWTPTGLLLHVHSTDVTPTENAADKSNDSVEVFLASSPGSDDRLHYIFSPARSTNPPKVPIFVEDRRVDPPPAVAPIVKTVKTGSGYDMTISIPWVNLKEVPLGGQVIGLQVVVNDAQTNGEVSRRLWYPELMGSGSWDAIQQVKLGGPADSPQKVAIWLQGNGLDEAVHVSALAADAGKRIGVWSSGQIVGEAELKPGGPDGSTAEIILKGDASVPKDALLTVTMNGNPMPSVLKMTDLKKRRLDLLKEIPLVADPSIFDAFTFPKIDFKYKEVVEEAFGPYSLKIRYFDAKWNEVTVPKEPGRYGALIEVHGENDLTFTRDLTLYKTPQPYSASKDPYELTVKFPAAFGLPSGVMAKEQWNVQHAVGNVLEGLPKIDGGWAGTVAALHDLADDPPHWHGFTVWTINNAWWIELHKRLGDSQDYPHVTQLPTDYDKDPKKKWPLLLFLHGAGERGDDLDKLRNQGPYGYIKSGHSLPFIVIEPQCPLDQSWDAGRLMQLIDQTAATYRVDPKRIYVTGLSMGGYGTLELAATYPDKIAAIASLSGGDNPELAARLKKMPTWLFHGDIDTVVPLSRSADLYHAMQKEGASVKMTVIPGVGHWGWQKTYSDPALYAWFLQHSK